MNYTYDRMWDASGDSIGWVLSDEAGAMAGVILEHPDDGPVLAARLAPKPYYWRHATGPLDEAAAYFGRQFHTDARPDDAAPARCLVATVEWTMRCCECRDEWVHTEHIRAGCEIRPDDDACPTGCQPGDTYVCAPRLVNVRSERVAPPAEADLRAQLADVQEQLARACEAIDEGLEEYASLERSCGDWSERCGKLEAALRECLSLAETGDCGAIAIAIEAALGESPHA